MTTITSFHGPTYGFLSNFYPCSIAWVDPWERPHTGATVEAVYQAEKSMDPDEYEQIIRTASPGQAKRLGRTVVPLREDWELHKYEVMYRAVTIKFTTHADLRELLLATGDALLVEGNHWHDNIWGDCNCPRCLHTPGENSLGKCLMFVRSLLQRTQT